MMPKRRVAGTVNLKMFSVPHLVVLFLVVLVLFGPHKLPELARGLGKLMAEFRKASNDFKMAFEEEMRNIERQNREAEWKKSQQEAEAKHQTELASSAEAASEPKILPEQVAASHPSDPGEPVVEPAPEAIAREDSDERTEQNPLDVSALPAEDATSSGPGNDSSENPSVENSPAHQPNDQRQPA